MFRRIISNSLVLFTTLQLTSLAWGQNNVDLDLDFQLGVNSIDEPAEVTENIDSVDGAVNTVTRLETVGYFTLDIGGLLQVEEFQALILAPLRMNAAGFGIREEDWDDPEDYLRAIPCARIDFMNVNNTQRFYAETTEGTTINGQPVAPCQSWTPEEAVGDILSSDDGSFDYLSIRMAPVDNYTLGYGSILDGYSSTLEENYFRDGLMMEWNQNRSLVVNAMLSDFLDPTVAAGRAALRPWVDGDEIFTEVGVTAAADMSAPKADGDTTLVIGGIDGRIRWSTTSMEGTPPGDHGLFGPLGTYQVFRLEAGAEVNEIFDYSSGIHGHLRFYYDIGAFDFYIEGEYRQIDAQYIPNYFDHHYRVQRGQYALSRTQRNEADLDLEETKLDALEALPDTTDEAYAVNFRLRFWPWDEARDSWTQADGGADIWAFAENIPDREQSGRAGAGFILHNIADRLNLQAEFVQQGWDEFSEVFELSSAVLNSMVRLVLDHGQYVEVFYGQTWFSLEDSVDPSETIFRTSNDFGVNFGFVEEGVTASAGALACGNTCGYAFDGECDDGGPGAVYAVCEYGTDCNDCGPREPR